MQYLIDTNTWIDYLKRAESHVRARLGTVPASEVAVCSIVWAELLYGARRYENRKQRAERIENTLAPFRSLPFDDNAAHSYASIRDNLESRGEVIGANDLLIAAIAAAHGLTVVSRDKGFTRIVTVHGVCNWYWRMGAIWLLERNAKGFHA